MTPISTYQYTTDPGNSSGFTSKTRHTSSGLFPLASQQLKLMAQSRGIRIHQYLDDWLIRAPTRESCHQGTQSLLALCQELGWIVNFQKSELEPKQVFKFVGYQYDLLHRLVKPTQNRWESILRKVSSILSNPTCRVRKFMSLIGLLTASRQTERPIQWHLKRHWRVPESLVTQPFNKARHRDLTSLNLHAWLLEPRQSRNRGSLAQWRYKLRLLKDVQPVYEAKGPFLLDGVKQVRWTSGRHLSNK